MKKNNLIKIIAYMFLIAVLLTWIIPVGQYAKGVYVEGEVSPVGLFDIIRYPLVAICTPAFISNAVIVLLIGALYGVFNKTGAYQNLVNRIVKKFKNKKNLFIILTTILFVILSSLTSLNYPLLLMVPFFATILLLLGYSKITTMLSTIGGILVGNVVSIYGYRVAGISGLLVGDINYDIIYRVILLLLVTSLLVFTVIKSSKTKEKVNKEDIALFDEVSSKKSGKGILVVGIIFMVIILVGMLNLESIIDTKIFSDIYYNITTFEINGYPLFKNLIGEMYKFGNWTNYELGMMIIILMVTIKCMYKIKFNDFVDGIKKGVKVMLPIAFYVLIVNVILILLKATSSDTSIYPSIVNRLLSLTKEFNLVIYSISIFIGSLLYNDFAYLIVPIYTFLNSSIANLDVAVLLTQFIHGIVQIIVPTSVMLVIGLKYFDISYKKWLKQIYKFILLVLLLTIIFAIFMVLI